MKEPLYEYDFSKLKRSFLQKARDVPSGFRDVRNVYRQYRRYKTFKSKAKSAAQKRDELKDLARFAYLGRRVGKRPVSGWSGYLAGDAVPAAQYRGAAKMADIWSRRMAGAKASGAASRSSAMRKLAPAIGAGVALGYGVHRFRQAMRVRKARKTRMDVYPEYGYAVGHSDPYLNAYYHQGNDLQFVNEHILNEITEDLNQYKK